MKKVYRIKTKDNGSYTVSYKNEKGNIVHKVGFKTPQEADAWVKEQGTKITAYKLLTYNNDIDAYGTVKVYNQYVKDSIMQEYNEFKQNLGTEKAKALDTYLNKHKELSYGDIIYKKVEFDKFEEWYRKGMKDSKMKDAHIYLFAKSDMTQKDLQEAKRYGLEVLGTNRFGGEVNLAVKGDLSNLKKFAREYLDYELHPNYLYKENEFAGKITKDADDVEALKKELFEVRHKLETEPFALNPENDPRAEKLLKRKMELEKLIGSNDSKCEVNDKDWSYEPEGTGAYEVRIKEGDKFYRTMVKANSEEEARAKFNKKHPNKDIRYVGQLAFSEIDDLRRAGAETIDCGVKNTDKAPSSAMINELKRKVEEFKKRGYDEEDLKITVDGNKVWFTGELSYNTHEKLANELDKIVAKYDDNAYFDAETSGRWVAFFDNKTVKDTTLNDKIIPVKELKVGDKLKFNSGKVVEVVDVKYYPNLGEYDIIFTDGNKEGTYAFRSGVNVVIQDAKVKDTWKHIENYKGVEIYKDDDTGNYGFSHNKGKRLYNTNKKNIEQAKKIIESDLEFLGKDSKMNDAHNYNIKPNKQITVLAPYDDADYYWAKYEYAVPGGHLWSIINLNHRVEKQIAVRTTNQVIAELEKYNSKINPRYARDSKMKDYQSYVGYAGAEKLKQDIKNHNGNPTVFSYFLKPKEPSAIQLMGAIINKQDYFLTMVMKNVTYKGDLNGAKKDALKAVDDVVRTWKSLSYEDSAINDAKKLWEVMSRYGIKQYSANTEMDAVKLYMKDYPKATEDDITIRLIKQISSSNHSALLASENIDSAIKDDAPTMAKINYVVRKYLKEKGIENFNAKKDLKPLEEYVDNHFGTAVNKNTVWAVIRNLNSNGLLTFVNDTKNYKVTHNDKIYTVAAKSKKDAAIKVIKMIKGN